MMKENTRKVFEYLKKVHGSDVTAADVGAAVGLETKVVNSCFTFGMQNKGLGIRTPAEIAMDDGTHKVVKFLSLTDAGLRFNPDAEEDN